MPKPANLGEKNPAAALKKFSYGIVLIKLPAILLGLAFILYWYILDGSLTVEAAMLIALGFLVIVYFAVPIAAQMVQGSLEAWDTKKGGG